MSLFVFSMPTTPAEALNMLPELRVYAVEVLMPSSRRNLFQKRKKVNSYYDKVILLANDIALELKDDPNLAQLHTEWADVAKKYKASKAMLDGTKTAMQQSEEIVQLY